MPSTQRVWSLVQQHQHHLLAFENAESWASLLELLTENLILLRCSVIYEYIKVWGRLDLLFLRAIILQGDQTGQS